MDQGTLILIILAFLTGIAAGYLSGLFGIGSGILLVPAAIFILDMEFLEAKALSLFVIMFIAPIGMLRHRTHGNLHPRTGLILGVPGACGSIIGVQLARELNTTYLKFLFAMIQFYTAYMMIQGKRIFGMSMSKDLAYEAHRKYLPAVGFIGGLSAGLLGIGGGVIMVPSMVALSYTMHSAVANSLMVIFINVTVATLSHAVNDELVVEYAFPLMLGAVLTVRKGADKSVSIDKEKLRKYFGYFMIIAGCYMLYKSFT